MRKAGYTIALLLTLAFHAGAQGVMSDSLYDYYHQRFREHFILLDTGQGGGIPVAVSWPLIQCDDEWQLQRMCFGKGMAPGQTGLLAWGDGTGHMGHYLAVLGTEYERFRRMGRNTDSTIREISIVVQSLRRLDLAGEVKYGLPPQQNGFLLRDDVTRETARHIEPKYGCAKSGFICRDGIADGNMMSQDQVIHLMFGIALTVHALPEEVKNIYTGNSLRRELIQQTDKMLRYMARNGWIILDPAGNNVPLGFSAVGYSFALARCGKMITGRGYGNFTSLVAGRPLWNTLEETPYQRSVLHNEVNLAMQLCLMTVMGPRNNDIFRNLCTNGHLEMYLLAEAYLHRHTPLAGKDLFAPMLHAVPLKGICNNSPGCENVPGWRCSNRWFHPDERNGESYEPECEFNGLDLMLLYNLYQIHFPDTLR